MTGNGYVSNTEPWWMQESREAMEKLSNPDSDPCNAVKPGEPAGYAPCTWTCCTYDKGHDGSHSWAADVVLRPVSSTPEEGS